LITLDGSYGEGGGQIIRYAVALSVLTQKPITINNIRAKRPIPGLRPQHFTAISCMAELCDAEVKGLSVDSKKLIFIPNEIKPKKFKFDIGTAGSIPLIYQAFILSSLHTSQPIVLELIGGTDVKWAPSWDYFAQVYIPLLQKMGITCQAYLERRGYYPKGGGKAVLTLQPTQTLHLPKHSDDLQPTHIDGIIHTSGLSDHISKRIHHAATKTIIQHNITASLKIEKASSASPGTGITLWTSTNENLLGRAVLGEKGFPAEQVGTKAAQQLFQEMQATATFDVYAFDQLLPYLLLCKENYEGRLLHLSNHAKTTMWLLHHFFDFDIQLTETEKNLQFSIQKNTFK